MFEQIIHFIKDLYPEKNIISLHEPIFSGNEKNYLNRCIDSTFVSYLGEFVTDFEDSIRTFTGADYAIATSNGTVALHAALLCGGVGPGDEVITQALTFVATANAISYCGARPVFVDSDRRTLGMSSEKLKVFLEERTFVGDDGACRNAATGSRIAACVPVHIFGHPSELSGIQRVCAEYGVPIIEDAAESVGSFYKGRHTGTIGTMGVLSFNGNKVITTGGGGMILTNDCPLAEKLKHITTTAKATHRWEFFHDQIGYNYRLPNVNAAIGCAQMENVGRILENKRSLARSYSSFFARIGIDFFSEPTDCHSNYWLNAIILDDKQEKEDFLDYSHKNGVLCRPAWRLLNTLPMYENCETDGLETARWLQDRLVNLPSSVRL
jgi:aminotransferase in exopolysaccharide biosynthesis